MFSLPTTTPITTPDTPIDTETDIETPANPENEHNASDTDNLYSTGEYEDIIPTPTMDPICNSTYNGQSLVTLTENDSVCMIGNVSDFQETDTGWIRQCTGETESTPAQCSANRDVGDPFIENPENPYEQKTSQDMIKELTSLFNS
jgi:hypothetical protein